MSQQKIKGMSDKFATRCHSEPAAVIPGLPLLSFRARPGISFVREMLNQVQHDSVQWMLNRVQHDGVQWMLKQVQHDGIQWMLK